MRPSAQWYVYALAAPGLPRRFRVAGHTLTSIAIPAADGQRGSIIAIAERMLAPPAVSEAWLREQHAIVVDLWRRDDRLLPVRFGTTMNEEELRARVASAASALVRILQQVHGRVQMTVRVFEDARSTVGAALPRTSGTAYLRALRARAASVSRLAAEVGQPVKPFVVEERAEPGHGALRLSLFHLIAAADEAEYRAALARSVREISERRRLTVSGPWPAFAFVPELFA